jgi:VIT1/CCC1 family predicted Fe2+/Mn2+ transporter
MIPVLVFDLSNAILISVVYGLIMLSILSYTINKKEKWKVIVEHITIALIVVIITHYIGDWIAESFV